MTDLHTDHLQMSYVYVSFAEAVKSSAAAAAIGTV
jgi:hypothetical protein